MSGLTDECVRAWRDAESALMGLGSVRALRWVATEIHLNASIDVHGHVDMSDPVAMHVVRDIVGHVMRCGPDGAKVIVTAVVNCKARLHQSWKTNIQS